MEQESQSAEHATRAHRDRTIARLAWVATVLVLYAFLLVMAHYEPLTGDGWGYESPRPHSVGGVIKSMVLLHNQGNARIGQLFTILCYGPGGFHLVVTPLMTLLMLLMIFVHAIGRAPRVDSSRDLCLFLCGAALCWLATPFNGQAYFYRPITTNYVYSMALSLVLLWPLRRPPSLPFGPRAIALAVVMLPIGAMAGMMNEHTGPTWILIASGCALLAYRRRDFGNACWMTSVSLGLLAGLVFLLRAPGLEHRRARLGQSSVFETITNRGFGGSVDLAYLFCEYIAPMLVFVLVLAIVFLVVRRPGTAQPGADRERVWTIAGYTLAAALITGTAFASPIHHYRLFLAPAVLTVIAGLAAVDLMAHERVVRAIVWPASIAVNLIFIVVMLGVYGDLHTDEMARIALLRGAKPGEKVTLVPFRHANQRAFFYGDTIFTDPHHAAKMAILYGVPAQAILLRGRPVKSSEQADDRPHKKRKSAKKPAKS